MFILGMDKINTIRHIARNSLVLLFYDYSYNVSIAIYLTLCAHFVEVNDKVHKIPIFLIKVVLSEYYSFLNTSNFIILLS